jgi:hypothetical protein
MIVHEYPCTRKRMDVVVLFDLGVVKLVPFLFGPARANAAIKSVIYQQ